MIVFGSGLVVGALLALMLGRNFTWNSGYAHGRQDQEQLDEELVRKTSINGKYKVKEEE